MKKMPLKISCAKYRPFSLDLNVLRVTFAFEFTSLCFAVEVISPIYATNAGSLLRWKYTEKYESMNRVEKYYMTTTKHLNIICIKNLAIDNKKLSENATYGTRSEYMNSALLHIEIH